MKAIPSGGDKPDGPKPRVSHVMSDFELAGVSGEWCEQPFEEFTKGQMINRLSHQFRCIEGRMKTLLDAVIEDKVQRKAAKDIADQNIWIDYENLLANLQLLQG